MSVSGCMLRCWCTAYYGQIFGLGSCDQAIQWLLPLCVWRIHSPEAGNPARDSAPDPWLRLRWNISPLLIAWADELDVKIRHFGSMRGKHTVFCVSTRWCWMLPANIHNIPFCHKQQRGYEVCPLYSSVLWLKKKNKTGWIFEVIIVKIGTDRKAKTYFLSDYNNLLANSFFSPF